MEGFLSRLLEVVAVQHVVRCEGHYLVQWTGLDSAAKALVISSECFIRMLRDCKEVIGELNAFLSGACKQTKFLFHFRK